MTPKILTWITFKGRRIPITERILRGATLMPLKESHTLLRKLEETKAIPKGITLYRERVDWKNLGIACRDVDRKFPGMLRGTNIIFVNSPNRDLKALTLNPLYLKRYTAFLDDMLKEVERRPRTAFQEYGLIPSDLTVQELNTGYVKYIQDALRKQVEQTRRIFEKSSRLLGSQQVILFDPSVKVTGFGSFVKTESDAWRHEFGHLLMGQISNGEFKIWNSIYAKQHSRIKSTYGKANPSEGFAEEFLQYVKGGKNSTGVFELFFETIEQTWKPF